MRALAAVRHPVPPSPAPPRRFTYSVASSAAQFAASDIWGSLSTYGAGGFYQFLPLRLKPGVRENMTRLRDAGFVDMQSRAIMAELTLYNPHTNLFTGIVLVRCRARAQLAAAHEPRAAV